MKILTKPFANVEKNIAVINDVGISYNNVFISLRKPCTLIKVKLLLIGLRRTLMQMQSNGHVYS